MLLKISERKLRVKSEVLSELFFATRCVRSLPFGARFSVRVVRASPETISFLAARPLLEKELATDSRGVLPFSAGR